MSNFFEHLPQRIFIHGPFGNYLQVVSHKPKITDETRARHQNQFFLMFFDELQIIFMVLIILHCVQSREILILILKTKWF